MHPFLSHSTFTHRNIHNTPHTPTRDTDAQSEIMQTDKQIMIRAAHNRHKIWHKTSNLATRNMTYPTIWKRSICPHAHTQRKRITLTTVLSFMVCSWLSDAIMWISACEWRTPPCMALAPYGRSEQHSNTITTALWSMAQCCLHCWSPISTLVSAGTITADFTAL